MCLQRVKRDTKMLRGREYNMIKQPRLTSTDDGEPAIDVTLDPTDGHNFETPSQRTFRLSARASRLIVDELEYKRHEEIASVTAKALLLTGGAHLTDQKTDPVDLVRRFRSPDGGKHPPKRELKHVANYLKRTEIEQRIHWLAEELVQQSQLSAVMDSEEIRSQRTRMNDLRGIAKDL